MLTRLGILFWLFVGVSASAQVTTGRPDTVQAQRVDTLRPAYVNQGKIAARRAVIQSAILPGLGQINNKVTVWSIGKVAAIYGGFVALTISYQENTRMYNIFLEELTYRELNGGQPNPNSIYAGYPTQGLYTAKDTYRRNREIIIFSYVGVYLINLVDAYVSTRLKYWNVDDDITLSLRPSLLNTNMGYASNQMVPGLKLSLKL